MAVLEAALKEQPGFAIARIDPAQPNAPEAVIALDPEVIVMDGVTHSPLSASSCPTLVAQWSERALIVLDLKRFVLEKQTQQYHPIQNVAELVDLIRLGRFCQMISI